MSESNDIMATLLKVVMLPRSDKIPDGWFCRRDIENALNCSEPTAIRYIRSIKKLEGYKEKFFYKEGKKVNFYTVSSPLESCEAKDPKGFTESIPTGEQTNPLTSTQSESLLKLKSDMSVESKQIQSNKHSFTNDYQLSENPNWHIIGEYAEAKEEIDALKANNHRLRQLAKNLYELGNAQINKDDWRLLYE